MLILFLKHLNKKRKLAQTYSRVYKEVWGRIKGIQERDFMRNRKTQQVLRNYDRKNNKQYELDYNTYLEIMRTAVINLFNSNKKNTLQYIKTEILRDALMFLQWLLKHQVLIMQRSLIKMF